MSDLAKQLEAAVEIAKEAGALLMEGWRRDPVVHKKGAIDLVTDFDLRAEKLLRERMAAAFPEHEVVAEEGEDDARGDWIWYVDPLDGTTNFAHGHFFFAVSLGLAHRGRPVLGVVHAPALATTWAGGDGLGATRNGAPCHVTKANGLGDALVATGFPYDRATSEENNLREAAHIIPQIQGIRRCGAAAIDVCLVADGTYDAYWEQKVNPWDVCGGMAVAVAAGAHITDYEGRAANASSVRLVVSNGALHPALLAAIATARR